MQGLKFTLSSHVGYIYNSERWKIPFYFKQNATSEHGRIAKISGRDKSYQLKSQDYPDPFLHNLKASDYLKID